MPIKSRWSIPIPEVSLPTYLFESPDQPLPTQPILIDADRPNTHYLTLSTYRLWAKILAVGLQKAGLNEGDRVLLFSGGNTCYPVVFMGVLMAGGIFTGANPSYVPRELAYQLKDSDAKFLLTSDASLEASLEAASMIGMGKERVFVFDDAIFGEKPVGRLGVRHWSTLFGTETEANEFRWVDRPPKETICCLNYSSGTTGVPKGVMITHRNYVANASQVLFMLKFRPNDEKLNNDTRHLCFLPLYHAMGQTMYIINSPKKGQPAYIMPKFDFVQVLKNLERFKITELVAVPPIIVALTKHPAVKTVNLSSLRTMLSGAAPLSMEVGQQAEKLFHPSKRVNLKQGWGMTEATCSILGWDPRKWSSSAAVGELLPNAEAILVNDDGNEVPRGERGEIWIRAPNVMLGYWRNPEATAETLTPDGWMKSGDIAYINEDNYFFIVDRKKELIKVKGNQVAPAELEGILLEHPSVADAAVVGVTIQSEEYPRAYIVLTEGAKVTEKEIAQFMEGKVSRTKRLVGGVKFINAIPKNPSGKILRKLLREKAKEETGDSDPRAARL